MYLLERDATRNTPSMVIAAGGKLWAPLGNSKEVLVCPKGRSEDTKDTSQKEPVQTKHHDQDKIEAGDLVYHKDRWLQVEEMSKDGKTASLKDGDKKVEAQLADCMKTVQLQILACSSAMQTVFFVEAGGRTTLSKLARKLCRKCNVPSKRADWYFDGKILDPETKVESLILKAEAKLACMMMGYSIKTYKRFPRLDDRGWYMSRSSKDSVTFVPSRAMLIFGFGMYFTREGPPTYTIGYELFVAEQSKKQASVVITKPNSDSTVYQVYFEPDQTPISVNAGDKVSVCVHYEQFDDASRLLVGTDGRNHSTVEGNEAGLLEVESHRDSGNGTDVNAGQLPELYYSTVD